MTEAMTISGLPDAPSMPAITAFRTVSVRGYGPSFDALGVTAVDRAVLILSIVAIFRYDAGMLQVLAACAAAGVLFACGALR